MEPISSGDLGPKNEVEPAKPSEAVEEEVSAIEAETPKPTQDHKPGPDQNQNLA